LNPILAKLDAIAGFENVFGDSNAAQIGSETAVQVEQRISAIVPDDSRMTTGNVLVVDVDVTVTSPADDGFIVRDSITAPCGFFDPANEEGILFPRRCFHCISDD
jgi:hypothetical protein